MAFEELKQKQSVMWGNGPYERVTVTLGDAHDVVVGKIAAQPGERWLDLATGTGAVAKKASTQRHARTVVIVAVLFAIAAAALGGNVANRLDPYGAEDPSTESVKAQNQIQDAGYRFPAHRRPDSTSHFGSFIIEAIIKARLDESAEPAGYTQMWATVFEMH